MKKAAVAGVVIGMGLLLAVGWWCWSVGSRYYEAKKVQAEMDSILAEMNKQQLGAYADQLEQAAGPEGRAELKKMVESFPRIGSGIAFEDRLSRREDGDDIILAPRVMYVWLDSPAHKAGILPGDDVVAISGDSTEVRCAKSTEVCPSKGQMTFLVVAISASDQTQTVFTVSRGGTKSTKTVTPGYYGKDIRDVLGPKLDGYYAQLDAVAPKIAALKAQIATADRETLKKLGGEIEGLVREVGAPYEEVSKYLQSHVLLAERVKPQSEQ